MAAPQNSPNGPKPPSKTPQYAPPATANPEYAPPAQPGPPGAAKADHAAPAKSGRASAARANHSAPKLSAVTITIDAESAEVVRVEGLDASGARHELSDEEKTRLLREGRRDERLAEVVEDAFEAGIACVLGTGEAGEEESTREDAEDAELRHLLLAPLIERSRIRHLTERAVLNRAILGTLIEHSTK